MWQLAFTLVDLWRIVGNQVLVFHRMQRQVNACQGADFACPQSARVDNVLGVNCAVFRDDIPRTIGSLIGFQHWIMKHNFSACHFGCFGIGVCRAAWVQMSIQWIIEGG